MRGLGLVAGASLCCANKATALFAVMHQRRMARALLLSVLLAAGSSNMDPLAEAVRWPFVYLRSSGREQQELHVRDVWAEAGGLRGALRWVGWRHENAAGSGVRGWVLGLGG